MHHLSKCGCMGNTIEQAFVVIIHYQASGMQILLQVKLLSVVVVESTQIVNHYHDYQKVQQHYLQVQQG